MGMIESNGLRILEVENKEENVFVLINGDEVAIIGKKIYLALSDDATRYIEMNRQEALERAEAFELKVLYEMLTVDEKHDYTLISEEQQKIYLKIGGSEEKLHYVSSILFEKLTEEEKEIVKTLTFEQGNLYVRLQTSADRESFYASLQPVESDNSEGN